ncbi:endolytic transglycosylase MltG [Mammaliicoccus sp. Dog046]|uniref:endolytic transglycosylase MltG n=1 Tax=Mammaliicoccus sp. Dog046 TaxID=3034233 RepID=UPI002B2628C8|nr:endolytic transglycosylase MltG [Mammaliicoccus sp. Dog046]WQK86537.1 endolytic transglycosylase MltG [Mammaliicoccus sp. Dog046]
MGKNSIYKDARLLSKYISLGIISILFLLFLLITLIGLCVIGINGRPVNADSQEQIIFKVNPNDTTEIISQQLAEDKLIRNETIFKYYLKLNNISSFQAGEYKFSPSMSLKDIATSLKTGKVYIKTAVQFDVKEGSNIELIAGIVEENTSISREEFLGKMKDRDFIKKYQKQYPKMLSNEILNKDLRYPLEGYLAPATYQFTNSNVSVDEIVQKMLQETTNTTYKLYEEEGPLKLTENYELKTLSFHEYLTMSSIVEAEMKNMTDKSRYTSLIVNRLENNPQSALNSDATVRYALKKEPSERLSEKDYSTHSPFNTYGQKGLPIGPINNFSDETARTTIHPPETDYYYYTTTKSGKVLFADTISQQEKNKEKQ